MTDGIFRDTAPLYWQAGLPVIPLWRQEKRPSPEAWQTYASEPVPAGLQQQWLSQYPNGNIGLVLGQQSGLTMVDIDTQDVVVQRVLSMLLPPTPWTRIGKKGAMLAYKWSGLKTFRIKNAQNEMIIEVLSDRTQCVLPPSIHPETKRPYEADSDLYDPMVRSQLLTLPPGIEGILRSALEAAGVKLSISGHTRTTDYVSQGARDVSMVQMAGFYAHAVLKGELTFKEALGCVVAWGADRVEKVAGDDIDIEKGVMKLAEFMTRDVTGPKQRALPPDWDKDLDDAERTAFGFDVFVDEHSAWDYDRLKTYIRQAFTDHDPESQARRDAVEFLLKRMAKSDLDKLDEDRLLKYVSQAGQMGFTVTSLKASLHDKKEGGIAGANHTEIAKAVIEDVGVNGKIVFTGGSFWQWKGSHWAKVESGSLMKTIAQGYGHLPLAKRQGDHSGIMKVMADLLRQDDLKQTSESGVNFANGFLMPDLTLRDHHPDYGCTYTLPYRYMPDLAGRAVKFDAFMHSSWGEDPDYEDKKRALQEFIAVTLFNMAPRFERVCCLHGPPKSGKSQMLKIITNLIPSESICAVGPEYWGDKFMPAQMHGKILNSCGELSERKFIDGTKFKTIVSGEAITGQHKNQNPFLFRATCAHIFATNHVPRTEDTSSAFNRRWLLLTYNKPVSDVDKVLDIGTLIAAEEREAIAAWAVEAIGRALVKGDYTLPASHEERIEEVARINNSLKAFLMDRSRVLLGNTVASGSTPTSEMDLYNAYYTSAIAAGVARPVALNIFRQKMRELGYELGFRIRIENDMHGIQTCVYESLTLVGNMPVARRRAGTGS